MQRKGHETPIAIKKPTVRPPWRNKSRIPRRRSSLQGCVSRDRIKFFEKDEYVDLDLNSVRTSTAGFWISKLFF